MQSSTPFNLLLTNKSGQDSYIIEFDSKKYKPIETPGFCDLCGLSAISLYVARREFYERIEIYKNNLKRKHCDDKDKIAKITQIDVKWFLFLEDFLEKRNQKFSEIESQLPKSRIEESALASISESSVAISSQQDSVVRVNLQISRNNEAELRAFNDSAESGDLNAMDQNLFSELLVTYPDLSNDTIIPDLTSFMQLFAIPSQKEMLDFFNSLKREGDNNSAIQSFKKANQYNQYFWMVNLFYQYKDQVNSAIQDITGEGIEESKQNNKFGIEHIKFFFQFAILNKDTLTQDHQASDEEKKMVILYSPHFIESHVSSHDCIIYFKHNEEHYEYLEQDDIKLLPFSTVGYYQVTPLDEGGDNYPSKIADEYKVVKTSDVMFLCGYNVIANFIKFLPPQQRFDTYQEILFNAWDKKNLTSSLQTRSAELESKAHETQTNPFRKLDEASQKKLQIELKFVEEFLKRKEIKKEEYRGLNPDNSENIEDLTSQKDQEIFEEIKEHFTGIDHQNRSQISEFNYQEFVDKFFLNPFSYNTSETESDQVKLKVTYDSNLRVVKTPIISPTAIDSSFEIWLSAMMVFYRDHGNMVDDEEIKQSFAELFPNSSINFFNEENFSSSEGCHPSHAFTPNSSNLLFLRNFQLDGLEELVKKKLALPLDRRSDDKLESKYYKYLFKILENLKKQPSIEPSSYQHFEDKTEYDDFFCIQQSTVDEEDDSPLQSNFNQEIFALAVKAFKTVFSFESQKFHAQNFNRLLIHNKQAHFSTLVTQKKFDNPFPREDSIESIYSASLNPTEINKNVEETIEDIFANKDSQSLVVVDDLLQRHELDGLEDHDYQAPSPSPNIFYRSLGLFERLKGRQDNNFRYIKSMDDSESFEKKFKEIIESSFVQCSSISDTSNNFGEEEVVLAMLIAKNFGGIGTKTKAIEAIRDKEDPIDHEKNLQELIKNFYPTSRNIVRNAEKNSFEISNQDQEIKPKDLLLFDKFQKLAEFSAIFQNQCSSNNIKSGNNAQGSKQFHDMVGLRLAFIPDQIVLEYLDKLPKDNQVRKLAMKLISQKSKISNQSYKR